MRIRGATLAATLVLGAAIFGAVPAHAVAAECALVGIVTLDDPIGLTTADPTDVAGSFGPGVVGGEPVPSSLTCVGAVTGVSTTAAGTFKACSHEQTGSHGSGCTPPGAADTNLDVVWDEAAETDLVAHAVGSVTFSGFTPLGGSCAFSFQGHALATQAQLDLTATGSGCGATIPAGSGGVATATSTPLLDPDLECDSLAMGVDCFEQVLFVGTLTFEAAT